MTGLGAIALAAAMAVTAVGAENGNSVYFKDVTSDNYGWAVEYVDYIARNGIASGVGNDMYAPGNNIIRGDFAILVDKTFDFKDGVLEVYGLKDVKESDYYAQSIADCYTHKVITDNGMFYPEKDITRIDAMTMIYRALVNTKNVNNLSTDTSVFKDGNLLQSIEQKTAAATLYNIGIIKGDDKDALNPANTMTRAEMAVVFAKLDQYMKDFAVSEAERLAQKEEQDKEKEKVKAEEKKETAKVNESKNYKDAEITKTVKVVNGGSSEIINSSIRVEDTNAVTVSNSSSINIEDTGISVTNGNGIEADKNAEVTVKGGRVTVENGTGIKAAKDGNISVDNSALTSKTPSGTYVAAAQGGKLSLTDTTITAADNGPALLLADGGSISLKDSTITAKTGVGKGSGYGAIDLKSTNGSESEITLENTVISNKSGAAFYARESNATINIKGKDNVFKTASFIDSPYIPSARQERGNNITINLTDKANLDDLFFILDNKTEITLNIENDCHLGVRFDNPASGFVNVTVEEDGILELNSDIYIEAFDHEMGLVFDKIIDNGYNIYYNIHNSENEWLTGNSYSLTYGGTISPVDGERR